MGSKALFRNILVGDVGQGLKLCLETIQARLLACQIWVIFRKLDLSFFREHRIIFPQT